MERDVNTYLFDVVENCKLIVGFVRGLDYAAYEDDELVKSAVERRFINIGEALNRLKQTDPEMFGKISDAHRIVGFRNVLVHGYESISDRLVWGIIEENLHELKVSCEKLLN